MVAYQNAGAKRPEPRPHDPLYVTRRWGSHNGA